MKTDNLQPANHQDEFCCLNSEITSYYSPPNWRLVVSPREIVIGIRSQWINFIKLVFIYLGIIAVIVWAITSTDISDDLRNALIKVIWILGGFLVLFLILTALYQKFRSKKAWFVCKPMERTISCPRLDKTFSIDQIQALQAVRDNERNDGKKTNTYAQLNLIVTENGQLKRYGLVGAFRLREILNPAELISKHCNIPLRVDKC